MASAGLESFVTHGFMTPLGAPAAGKKDKLEYAVEFVRDNLTSYARSALPFVSDAHLLVQDMASSSCPGDVPSANIVQSLQALDDLYEAMTLNHVARRASKTQGVALLSLYSKGFSKPSFLKTHIQQDPSPSETSSSAEERDNRIEALVDKLKLAVRREDTPGHLPICWGVLTAALGLSLGASIRSSQDTAFLSSRCRPSSIYLFVFQSEANSCTCSCTRAAFCLRECG